MFLQGRSFAIPAEKTKKISDINKKFLQLEDAIVKFKFTLENLSFSYFELENSSIQIIRRKHLFQNLKFCLIWIPNIVTFMLHRHLQVGGFERLI